MPCCDQPPFTLDACNRGAPDGTAQRKAGQPPNVDGLPLFPCRYRLDLITPRSLPGGRAGDAAVVGADTGAGLEFGGNGSGTPNMTPSMTNNVAAAVSPGTWSPQWGWYVTMTPPQVSLASSECFFSICVHMQTLVVFGVVVAILPLSWVHLSSGCMYAAAQS